MATAPRNPYIFFIFFGVIVAAFMILDAFVDVSYLDNKPNYHTADAERMKAELREEQSKKAKPKSEKKEEQQPSKVAMMDSTNSEVEPLPKTPIAEPENISGSIQKFEEGLRAYKAEILSQLEPGAKRMDVLVRYYPHEPDGEAVYNLRSLGYYLHERPTQAEFADKPSNSLYYGDNVPLKDIQLVAITLLDTGIPLKQIKESKFHADWKSNSLEIGADTLVNTLPVLSKQDIRQFTK